MISFDRQECAGGVEYKILLSPLARELIRAAGMIAGVGVLILIYCLIGG